MHGGFYNLRSALPMNLRARYPGFKVWAGAQPDIAWIIEIWSDCLRRYRGPYLCGPALTVADAIFAPVCTRFWTYDVPLDPACAAYRDSILAWPLIAQWTRFVRSAEARRHAVFLADYDMLLTEQMVQGVDLWINTPRRPWEASGTSGMKVLVNGGINLSELDGWWAEAY